MSPESLAIRKCQQRARRLVLGPLAQGGLTRSSKVLLVGFLELPLPFLSVSTAAWQRLTRGSIARASEVLKLAWVQVLAFLIPTWVVVEWLKAGLLLEGLLSCRASSHGRSPLQCSRSKLVQVICFFPRSLQTPMHFNVQCRPWPSLRSSAPFPMPASNAIAQYRRHKVFDGFQTTHQPQCLLIDAEVVAMICWRCISLRPLERQKERFALRQTHDSMLRSCKSPGIFADVFAETVGKLGARRFVGRS